MTRVGVAGVVLAVRRRGSGQPTVLLHGGGPGCASGMDFMAVEDLLADGRELVLVDLAQYGDSDAPRIDGPVLDFHSRILVGLLDALALPAVDIVAQSLGGGVALRLAASHPDRVRRVVATGSQPVPFANRSDPRIGLGMRARESYYGGTGPTPTKMRELMSTFEWRNGTRIPDRHLEARYMASVTAAGLRLGLDHAARGRPQDIGDALGVVRAPVLLVWGAHDPFSDPDYARAVAERMPNARVEVIDGTAHHPQSERPEQYARVVLDFLNGIDQNTDGKEAGR